MGWSNFVAPKHLLGAEAVAGARPGGQASVARPRGPAASPAAQPPRPAAQPSCPAQLAALPSRPAGHGARAKGGGQELDQGAPSKLGLGALPGALPPRRPIPSGQEADLSLGCLHTVSLNRLEGRPLGDFSSPPEFQELGNSWERLGSVLGASRGSKLFNNGNKL